MSASTDSASRVIYRIGTPCSPEQQAYNDAALEESFRQTQNEVANAARAAMRKRMDADIDRCAMLDLYRVPVPETSAVALNAFVRRRVVGRWRKR
jgi:hypothetical protein